jgi:protein phosphatase
MDLKQGVVCDRGLNPRRPVNEDRYLALPRRGLFAVFDGVGGQRAGEVASQTAAETIEEALAQSTSPSADAIRRAIQFANRDIYELAQTEPSYRTMATTVALLQIENGLATIAHVGDSRVYRLEEGRFYRETIDHTDFNDGVRAGLVAQEASPDPRRRNVINRALGIEPEVEVELKSVCVSDGVRFLLCSDGIYSHMPDEEIAAVLAEHKDPQRAADELKRIVYQRGADDNLTAVVIQVGRPRQSKVIAIEDAAPPPASEKRPQVAQTDVRRSGSSARGRIEVEVARPSERSGVSVRTGAVSFLTPKATYLLVLGALVAAAFYVGLRASELSQPSVADPVGVKAARDAFERGDLPAAEASLVALIGREPQNSDAHYWLGRVRLELGEFAGAAGSFEEAIKLDPGRLDSYPQAAACYEALGDRARATAMLARYAQARRQTLAPR